MCQGLSVSIRRRSRVVRSDAFGRLMPECRPRMPGTQASPRPRAVAAQKRRWLFRSEIIHRTGDKPVDLSCIPAHSPRSAWAGFGRASRVEADFMHRPVLIRVFNLRRAGSSTSSHPRISGGGVGMRERIRSNRPRAARHFAWPCRRHRPPGPWVTGVATGSPQAGRSCFDVVDCADKALYEAKRSGRNCVVTGTGA